MTAKPASLTALAAALLLAGCGGVRRAASLPAIQRGHDAIAKQDYATAAKEYEQVIAINPNDGEAYASLGICQMHLGNLPQAEQSVNKGLSLAPNDFLCLTNASSIYLKEKKYQDARGLSKQMIALNPTGTKGYRMLALADIGLKDWNGTIDACAQGAQLDPRDAIPHVNWAIALGHKGKYEAALSEDRWALGLNPKHAYALRGIAFNEIRLKEFAEAETASRKALQLDPKSAQGHLFLGNALSGEGKTLEAMAEWNELVKHGGPEADEAAAAIKQAKAGKKGS